MSEALILMFLAFLWFVAGYLLAKGVAKVLDRMRDSPRKSKKRGKDELVDIIGGPKRPGNS